MLGRLERKNRAAGRLSLGTMLVVALYLVGCEFMFGTEVVDLELPADFSIPINLAMPDQAAIESTEVNGDGFREIILDPIYQDIDLARAEPEVGRYGGRVKMVRVNSITFRVTSNTLTTALQPLPICIGSADGTFEQGSHLATTLTIAAGTVGTTRANISETGRSTASVQMQGLSFGVGAAPTFLVAEDYLSNEGGIEAELVFDVTVVANALE